MLVYDKLNAALIFFLKSLKEREEVVNEFWVNFYIPFKFIDQFLKTGLFLQWTVGGVRGTVGLATDLVPRRVDMGQKSTKERDTVTILTQSTEEEDAMDRQWCTPINNAMSKHVPVC